MSQKDKTISLATAKDWTSEWRSEESDYNKHNKCNAFLIHAEVLQAVLEAIKDQSGVKKVRAYLGVDAATNEEKLIIVGTQPETQPDGSIIYRDIINESADGADLENSASGIWDFTVPCPPKCDPKSPLN